MPGDIIILHLCTSNDSHMMYGSWDMECDRQNFFLILDHFSLSFLFILSYFLPFCCLKNQNLEKWKIPRDITSYTCVLKIMIRWCTVPKIWCAKHGRTDGWTEGRKKWHIEVGAPLKKIYIFIYIFGNKTISITLLELLLSPATSLVFSTSCT